MLSKIKEWWKYRSIPKVYIKVEPIDENITKYHPYFLDSKGEYKSVTSSYYLCYDTALDVANKFIENEKRKIDNKIGIWRRVK